MKKVMDMYEKLYHEFEANDLIADEMTIWAGSEGTAEASGFIVYNHIGIDKLRNIVGKPFKVYAFRESDELDGDPATIENQEVYVNFFGYFVTETDLDWLFKEREYVEMYSWDYDPWGNVGEANCALAEFGL
jgi:hypothetical protein